MRQQRNFGNKIYESMRREIIVDAGHTSLLNSQLLAKGKVFKNYALFAPEYEP